MDCEGLAKNQKDTKIIYKKAYKKPKPDFDGKLKYQCNCNNTRCIGKYCGCFKNNLKCTDKCGCVNIECLNMF